MSDTELIKFNAVWKIDKYFWFELHTWESQDCSIQASQRLVSKKLHTEEQVQVEEKTRRSEKRKTSYNTFEENILSVYCQTAIKSI